MGAAAAIGLGRPIVSICLTNKEIQELTNRKYYAAQARELDHLGIPYKPRTDGSLIVLRVHVEVEQKRKVATEPQLHLN